MDKKWMHLPRHTVEYQNGIKKFMEFAFSKSARADTIRCPCNSCANLYWLDKSTVYDHLICNGFLVGYSEWMFHGEDSFSQPFDSSNPQVQTDMDDEIDAMLREGLGFFYDSTTDVNCSDDEREQDVDMETYYRLANEASKQLYPGCQRFSKLQFIVRLLNIKNLWGVTNACFDELLALLKEALPKGESLPKSYHEARKFIKDVGVGYVNIDACINDCILYRKEYANASSCPTCGTSRWKSEKVGLDGKHVHRVPIKVVRHFPLKRRLQRIFMSPKTASDARWHNECRMKDGFLRHPADSTAWRDFDFRHPEFGSECRNIRLALATDGFNPFGTCSVSHSTWPVILIPYNFPPWICMKPSNFILSLLISGPKSPGNNMDVYLQLVIEELHYLFCKGVRTFDASCSEWFTLRAAVLGTISDYPGNAYLSGRKTNREVCCATCYSGTCFLKLKHGHKACYMGHRRFLPLNHKFRHEAKAFDGTKELREAPTPISGYDVSEQTKDLHIVFGKLEEKKRAKKRRRGDEEIKPKWNKRSCFFQLPYWETLLIRHNLDVMHIEKNVFDNILNTLLNVDKKSKDGLNARLDLQTMGIRPDLHPIAQGNKTYLPPAIFTMNISEKKMFCQVLKDVKFPDGYASNLHNKVLVDQRKLIGLKSHDCHVIMQHLLPLAIRRILPQKVCTALIRLSNFFKQIYSKVISVSEMEKLEFEISETLCLLEKIFPPSFFDIMVHLCVHLPTEARLAGPVQYRNMYPIERCVD